jgi:uncharacterized membrane protein YesL
MGRKSSLIEVIYRLSNLILRLVYINFLWILFSLLGLLIAGFFPSTVAMFTVVRIWVLGETDAAIFNMFWKTFKNQFLKSNILGYSLSSIGAVLYADILYLQQAEHYALQMLYFPVLFISFLYLLSLFYIIPIFVHYDIKGIYTIKNALLIPIITPFTTLKMCLGLLLIVYIMIALPGSIILFCGSVTSYFIMRTANSAFIQYEQKRAKVINQL